MKKQRLPIPVVAALLASALDAQVELKPRAQDRSDNTSNTKAGSLSIGDRLPRGLELRDLSGQAHDLGAYRGKVLLLHFWSRDCPVTARHQSCLNRLAAKYRDHGAVACLAVNANQDEIGAARGAQRSLRRLKQQARQRGIRSPILLDHGNQLSRLLKARTTPHVYVFDAQGRLRYAGALSDDPRGRKQDGARLWPDLAVDSLLAGEEVATPATAPWGRSIETQARRRPRD